MPNDESFTPILVQVTKEVCIGKYAAWMRTKAFLCRVKERRPFGHQRFLYKAGTRTFGNSQHYKASTPGLKLCRILPPLQTPVSDKLKALLRIAGKVQQSGKAVLKEDIEAAKKTGATDEDIHDAILIASSFCMYNRYVDGLGTVPAASDEYPDMGKRLAKKRYKYPPLFLRPFIVKMMNKKRNKPDANNA